MNMPKLLLSLVLSCLCVSVHALQLGQLRATSTLGQPLDARVAIYGADTNNIGAYTLRLKPDITAPRGGNERRIVESMQVSVQRDQAGTPYIALRSTEAIDEPVVRFRLRASDGSSTAIHHFTLALSPARYATPKREPAAAAPVVEDTPKQTPALASSFSSTSSNYGPVRSGQSLWRILRELGLNNGNTETLIQEIVARNPHAFTNADPNRLKVGVNLEIPQPSAASAELPEAAANPPAPEILSPESNQSKPADNVVETEPVESQPAQPVSQVGAIATEASASGANLTSTTGVQSKGSENRFKDPAIEARLAELERKFKAIRARYAAQQAQANKAETTQAETEAGTSIAAAPAETPTAVVVDDEIASTGASPASPATATAPADTASVSETAGTTDAALSLSSMILVAFAVVLGLMALTVAILAYRRRWHAAKLSGEQAASDEQQLAEIARKTEKRLQLEDEVKKRISEKRTNGADAPRSTVERSVEKVEQMGAAQETSLEEIENRIAHGQYAEAEQMLNVVIANNAKNYRAKLRLAEIYYLNERTDEFVDLANELATKHREDIGDEGWQRVMRMGKVVAPERPPFSGPVAVDQSSS